MATAGLLLWITVLRVWCRMTGVSYYGHVGLASEKLKSMGSRQRPIDFVAACSKNKYQTGVVNIVLWWKEEHFGH